MIERSKYLAELISLQNNGMQMRKVVSAVQNLCFIPQGTCIDIFTAIRIVQQTYV